MTITITYKFQPGDFPYWARTVCPLGDFACCGTSFADARARLLEKLRGMNIPPPSVPDPEDVEL